MTTDPKKKKPAARRVRKAPAKPDLLSPGDTVEHSLSIEVRGPSGAVWIKSGVTTQVRPGEDAASAQKRAEDFVARTIDRKARAIIAGRA